MLVIVPVAEIEGIFLTERRIVLRSSASIEASGRRGGHGRARASANGHAAARMMAEGLEHVVAGWCQGAVAEDAEGRAVRPWSAEARRWSLLGALLASWKGGPINDLGQALSALHTATDPSPLDLWNDRAERTQHDVVAAFERAIESVRSDKGTTFPNDERFGSWLRACSAGVSSWFR
jgi:hypothetical protein